MRTFPILAVCATSAAALLLAGCSGLPAGKLAAPAQLSANMHGKTFGGQQPVANALVQLWQAGSTGYGAGATALLAGGGVFTDGGGNFSFDQSAYSCTSGSMVYITATGGDAGSGPNSSLAMMAGLGLCDNLNNNTFVDINEVTTVGTVWALSQFMTGTASSATVGAPSTNTAGLIAAFADINTLVNTGIGSTPGPAAGAGTSVPSQEIFALANSLAACVNTAGATGSGSPCDMLFGYTTPSGGSAPQNVLAAALNITRNPATNAGNIINLGTPTAPFASTFTTANDLTLAITYTGNGITAPTSVAIDASGNVWITNSTVNTVTEITHVGMPLSGANGFNAGSLSTPSAIAIDTSGNAWIANKGSSKLTELNASGANVSGSPFSGGGLSTPVALSIDAPGNIWLANYGNNSASEFSSAGVALSPPGTGYTASGVSAPVGIAINPH